MTKYREALSKDCKEIAHIYNYYLGQSTMDTEPKSDAFYLQFLNHKDDREELWVIELEEEIIGWGIIKLYSPKKGYQYTGETSVYLDQNHLLKGHGTEMKKHLIQRCRTLNYHHLLARIFATNDVSITYNQKLGYRIIGRQKEVGYVNGEWKDVVIMELLLKDT